MRINTSQVEAVLMDKTVSAYRLAKEIGIQESSISLLRNGKKDFNKLSLEVAIRLSYIFRKPIFILSIIALLYVR